MRRLGPIGGLPGAAGRDPFRPLAAPSCALRLRSGEGVPMATAIISGGRAFRTATPVFSIPPWSRLKPLLPIEIGLPGRCAPGVGLRRRKRRLPGRRRLSRRLEIGLPGRCAPGVGLRRRKRHPPGRRRLSRRLEIGLLRRSAPRVGLRRRKRHLPVGAGRPLAEGPWRPNSFGAQANPRP